MGAIIDHGRAHPLSLGMADDVRNPEETLGYHCCLPLSVCGKLLKIA